VGDLCDVARGPCEVRETSKSEVGACYKAKLTFMHAYNVDKS